MKIYIKIPTTRVQFFYNIWKKLPSAGIEPAIFRLQGERFTTKLKRQKEVSSTGIEPVT